MTDRLTLARALEEGGIARDAAEHIATEILEGVHHISGIMIAENSQTAIFDADRSDKIGKRVGRSS